LQRASNSSVQLTLAATWRHTLSAGSDPVSAVAGRCAPIRWAASVAFQIRFQNPSWDPDAQEMTAPLSENEVTERFENYPWMQEYSARRHKLTSATFAVYDLDDGRSLLIIQVGTDSPAFFMTYGTTREERFLRVFRRTRLDSFHASGLDLSAATAIVGAFASRDEQRLTGLAAWRQT